MLLTLELWRSIPDSYPHSPIVAKMPEFGLRAHDEGFKIRVTMNVVIGKGYGHDTSLFSDTME
ncbi:MAG: hypothetical protein ABSD75_07650 [Terriglobales bacterium]